MNSEKRTKLFSKLGVVSGYPVIRQAAEIFERISKEPVVRVRQPPTLGSEARNFVNVTLRRYERSQGLVLSNGARQLLRVPVVETAEFAEQFDREQTNASLANVLATLKEQPRSPAEGTDNVRTSVAVIRAFWKNFCNIPPFCSGR